MSLIGKWLTHSAYYCKSDTVRLTGANYILRVGDKTKRLSDDRVACAHCVTPEQHNYCAPHWIDRSEDVTCRGSKCTHAVLATRAVTPQNMNPSAWVQARYLAPPNARQVVDRVIANAGF